MSGSGTAPTGWAGFADGMSDENSQNLIISSLLSRLQTASLVQVKSVTGTGLLAPVGFCSVSPLVHQMDGAGNVQPHGIINNLPYFRLQGGQNAVIMDPEVGDIGLALFASRDISSVKATKAAAPPGSRRRHDWADGLYLGGFLNGAPQQYVQFLRNRAGINVISPGPITLQAPTVAVEGNLTVTGTTTGQGDGVFANVSVANHVQSNGGGTGNSGPPVAGT